MVIFFPSIHPNLRNSCWKASQRIALPEAVLESRIPMRKIFPLCCASVDAQSAKSIAQRAKLRSFRLFISPSHLTQRAAVLVLCLNLGRTYTFHCRKKKQAGLKTTLEMERFLLDIVSIPTVGSLEP